MHKDQVKATYEARIDNINDVHDGDTINHVLFKLPIEIQALQDNFGEVYPEIFLQNEGVWVHVNVRVAGIDTPELHPRHRDPEGFPRPVEEVERERELAERARKVVADLLEENNLKFEIRNPEEGKYAGRVVAEVWIFDKDAHRMINIAEHLIDKGLGYPYAGGTKRVWGKD